MQRTYSRKGANRKRVPERPTTSSSDLDAEEGGHPGKRHKLQERTSLSSTMGLNLKSRDESLESPKATASRKRYAEPHPRQSVASPANARRNTFVARPPHVARHPSPPMNADPTRQPVTRADTVLDKPLSQRAGSPLPANVARDLSSLFDFTTTSTDPSKTQAKSHSSIAKRMLRRTATESSSSSVGGSFALGGQSDQTHSAPRTPTKLTKARSDSIIDLTEGSPLSQPLSPGRAQSLEDISSPALPARPSLAPTNMKTYAGKSRSFLVALPAAQFGVGGMSRSNSNSNTTCLDDGIGTQEDDLEIHETYTDLRMRWGVDNSEDEPRHWSLPPESGSSEKRRGKGKQAEVIPTSLPNGMMNDLRSITELRSKGENRRFLDEVGYLYEGLEASSPLSVRRGSALEIVTKLCDVDFARKTKAADFLDKTWEVLRAAGAGSGDKVLDTILSIFAALASRDVHDLAELAERSDFLSVLYRMLEALERANDPLWLIACGLSDAELRRAGIPKVDKILLAGLEKLIRKKSGLFESGEIISNRLLISTALAALPSSCQETTHFPSLLYVLKRELASLSSRQSAYASGLPIFPELPSTSSLEAPTFEHADNFLRLLDSYLLGRWTRSEESHGSIASAELDPESEGGLVESIISLCNVCDIVARDSEHRGKVTAAYKCMESALRVLISITHDNLRWCQAVLDDHLVLLTVRLIVQSQRQRDYVSVKREEDSEAHPFNLGAEDEGAAPSLDRQCLALGLLTNLAQVSYAAKDVFRNTLLSLECAGRRTCVTSCHCSSRVSALSCLALVYLQHCKSESEEGVEPVIRGHMAVLFGLLMRDCAANERVLLDALTGKSDRQKLVRLLEHARDFTSFYVEFTRRVSQVVQSQLDHGGLGDIESVPVTVDDRIGKVLSDSQGEAIARDVITFIEELIGRRR